MRLATLRTGTTTAAVRIDGETFVEIAGFEDVGALLASPGWSDVAARASAPAQALPAPDAAHWAPVVPRPSKIVCVGLNYASHIREMGRELPPHPTLFAKYPEALIGPYDPIVLPAYAAGAVDWEGELAIVIGAPARRLDPDAAASAIAGYAVLNDVTMRDYQYRTPEWFQGKTFERTTPFGPWLVTADEFELTGELRTEVDDEIVQSATVDDLVFSPAHLVSYISHIVPLRPGDVIASGTPGGVGHARSPQRYLAPGNVLATSIEGIGGIRSTIELEG